MNDPTSPFLRGLETSDLVSVGLRISFHYRVSGGFIVVALVGQQVWLRSGSSLGLRRQVELAWLHLPQLPLGRVRTLVSLGTVLVTSLSSSVEHLLLLVILVSS